MQEKSDSRENDHLERPRQPAQPQHSDLVLVVELFLVHNEQPQGQSAAEQQNDRLNYAPERCQRRRAQRLVDFEFFVVWRLVTIYTALHCQ